MKKQIDSATAKLKNFEASSGLVDLDVDDIWESARKELERIVSATLATGGFLENSLKSWDLFIQFLELTSVKESKKDDDDNKEMDVDEDKEKGADEENEDAEKNEEEAEAVLDAKEKEVLLQEGLIKVANMLVENKLKEAVALAFELTKKYDVQNVFGYSK
jgi:hypothetical protein